MGERWLSALSTDNWNQIQPAAAQCFSSDTLNRRRTESSHIVTMHAICGDISKSPPRLLMAVKSCTYGRKSDHSTLTMTGRSVYAEPNHQINHWHPPWLVKLPPSSSPEPDNRTDDNESSGISENPAGSAQGNTSKNTLSAPPSNDDESLTLCKV